MLIRHRCGNTVEVRVDADMGWVVVLIRHRCGGTVGVRFDIDVFSTAHVVPVAVSSFVFVR